MNQQWMMIIIFAASLLSILYYVWVRRWFKVRLMIWLPSLVIAVFLAGTAVRFVFFQQGYSAIMNIISFILLGALLVAHLIIASLIHMRTRSAA